MPKKMPPEKQEKSTQKSPEEKKSVPPGNGTSPLHLVVEGEKSAPGMGLAPGESPDKIGAAAKETLPRVEVEAPASPGDGAPVTKRRRGRPRKTDAEKTAASAAAAEPPKIPEFAAFVSRLVTDSVDQGLRVFDGERAPEISAFGLSPSEREDLQFALGHAFASSSFMNKMDSYGPWPVVGAVGGKIILSRFLLARYRKKRDKKSGADRGDGKSTGARLDGERKDALPETSLPGSPSTS